MVRVSCLWWWIPFRLNAICKKQVTSCKVFDNVSAVMDILVCWKYLRFYTSTNVWPQVRMNVWCVPTLTFCGVAIFRLRCNSMYLRRCGSHQLQLFRWVITFLGSLDGLAMLYPGFIIFSFRWSGSRSSCRMLSKTQSVRGLSPDQTNLFIQGCFVSSFGWHYSSGSGDDINKHQLSLIFNYYNSFDKGNSFSTFF